jgi:hypothetical protein
MYSILFFAHKNTYDKTNTHLLSQNAMAASSNYSKAGPRERMAVHAAKAWNSEEVTQKSWFSVAVGFGLRRSKP